MSDSLRKLYPNIVTTNGDIAYDANGNEVDYDYEAVIAQEKLDAQAVIDAKASALAKLSALGLTINEISALGVK